MYRIKIMKCIILAGGFGTRFSEETDNKPKPMIQIGGKPILWHIMKIYESHNITDFIICLGYKGYVIKEYFSNYFLHMSDVTINLKNNKLERILPAPLATPKDEILIKDSSASAYEVKKGDYIQIIDLYGRQCSDFMAFDSRGLQHGEELSIDTTASRAIVGGAYAMPGLHSKYFDKNLEPLVLSLIHI